MTVDQVIATCWGKPEHIERCRPPIDGIHAIYYDGEAGELTGAVKAALADRARLRAIRAAARPPVLVFHAPAAIARHIVDANMEMAPRVVPPRAGAG